MFYPPFSVAIHGGLLGLYIASASYQGGSDESDPKHPQSGAPWYISKKCSVAKDPTNIPYCKQAKALFAITIIIMYVILPVIFPVFQLCLFSLTMLTQCPLLHRVLSQHPRLRSDPRGEGRTQRTSRRKANHEGLRGRDPQVTRHDLPQHEHVPHDTGPSHCP